MMILNEFKEMSINSKLALKPNQTVKRHLYSRKLEKQNRSMEILKDRAKLLLRGTQKKQIKDNNVFFSLTHLSLFCN